MSRRPGPTSHDAPSPLLPDRTPGSLGIRDAGDRDTLTLIGDTPGTLGVNDEARDSTIRELRGPIFSRVEHSTLVESDPGQREFESFLEFLRQEGTTGSVTSGEMLKLGPHGAASRNRTALGVSGRDVQSAHNAPQSVMRNVPGYNPDHALTLLMERHSHSGMDLYWKETFQNMRRAGATSATAQNIYDVVAESVRRTPGMGDGEKFSIISRLSDEMFVEFGLQSADILPLPYPNVKP